MFSRGLLALLAICTFTPPTLGEASTSSPKIEVRSTPFRSERTGGHNTGQQHEQLVGSVHPETDTENLAHLEPRSSGSLFYTRRSTAALYNIIGSNIYLNDPQLVANLEASFHWTTVILDNSQWVKNVTCKPKSLNFAISNTTAYQSAKKNWTLDNEIVFVSSKPGCHAQFPGQFGFFNASKVVFDDIKHAVTATGNQIAMKDAVAEYNVAWGDYEQAEVKLAQVKSTSTSTKPKTAMTFTSSTSSKKKKTTAKTTSSSVLAKATSSAKTSGSSAKPSSSSSKPASSSAKSSSSSARSSSSSVKTSSSSAKSSSSSSKSSTSSSKSSSSSTKPSSSSLSQSSTATRGVVDAAITSSSFSISSSSSSSSSSSTVSTSSRPTKCGVLPATIPAGLPHLQTAIPCGSDFDESLDSWLAFIGDEGDFDKVIGEFAPGVSGISLADYQASTGSTSRAKRSAYTLERRNWLDDACSWVDNHIVQPLVNTIVEVVHDVVSAIATVIEVISEAAQEVVNAIRAAAQAILPSWHPSISFTIPINMGVPDSMLDDSPWGDAYQMYEYSQGEGEFNFGLNAGTLAKMVGADELLTFEIDGVVQLPEPGIQLYCVDCGVTGKMTTRGTATFTLLVGFTDLELALNGDIHATLQLGLNAYAEWEHELGSARIFKVPIGGFSIPEVIDVGPMLTMDVDATIGVKALGQVLAGAKLDWDRIGATINFFDMSKSEAHGFLPYITPVFNVSGQITAEASIGLPIGIAIGIDILDGLWEEEVALVDRPALAFSATYSASYNTEDGGSTGQDGCDGISWGVQFENSLELELPVLGKFDIGSWESGNFLEGCVGDNGVSMVQQQEQPVPAGQTRAGCTIYSQLVQNPGFDVLDANGYATPWTYSKNYDELQVFLLRDSVTSSQPFSLGIYIESGGDQNKVYSMTFYAPFTACTANNYDINFKMRQNYGNGICTLVSVGVFSYSNPLLNVLQDPQTVLPIHADHMDSYGPYSFAVPAYNNHAQETLYTGVTVECKLSTQFEVLLDDFTITPWFFNKEKRDLDQRSDEVTMQPGGSSQYWKRDDSVDYHPFQVKPTKTSDSPASPEGYEAPIITPSFIAPPLSAATYDSASVLPNYEAPAVSANWVAPVITAVATTKLVGSYPPNADPTAVATRIGDSTYDFEPLADIMASAKLGAIGSLPTDAATTEASNGYTNLRDLTATVQMASANDGNIYLTGYPSGSAGTKFLSKQSVIVKDEGDRLLHYYPDTMTTYGVSRIRAASIEESPLTSQLLTLIPLNTGDSGTVYAASDTVGNIFLLAFCTSTSWPGSKVFLVKDYDASLTELQSSEVQWVVTGAQVDTCAPLLVTSNAVPLA